MGRKQLKANPEFDPRFDEDRHATARDHAAARKQRYPRLVRDGDVWFKNRFEPRTEGQAYYMSCLRESTVTFCTGPAGVGKSVCVTRVALEGLASNQYSRIVITRPLRQAPTGDENTGALPGTLEEKYAPHAQAIMEAVEFHIGAAATRRLVEDGKIVFIPVSFMRGKTLSHDFVIADEAQNYTVGGLKLLLTRLGEGSTIAVNGDVEQCDLRGKGPDSTSGLATAIERLRGRDGRVSVVELTSADQQRHDLLTLFTDLL
jgi:phosphate starvation-inducible PhoH-like protein